LELDAELPPFLAYEVRRLAHEALINAARHAAATRVELAVGIRAGRVEIVVTDDGHGFPFQGTLDHVALTSRDVGPRSLRERVTALDGTLTVHSSRSGATVEIALPLSAA
jgi:signal transduction histidine kinase